MDSMMRTLGFAALVSMAGSACAYDYDQFDKAAAGAPNQSPSATGGAPDAAQGGDLSSESSGRNLGGDSTAGASNAGESGGTTGANVGGASNIGGSASTAAGDTSATGGATQAAQGGTTSEMGVGGTLAASTTNGGSDTGGAATGGGATGGASTLDCGTSRTQCGSVCADLSSDANHCGQCNIDCTTGSLAFSCYSGSCGCSLPANCGSGSGVDCVSHVCVCNGTTCSAGQVCQKHGANQNCAAP